MKKWTLDSIRCLSLVSMSDVAETSQKMVGHILLHRAAISGTLGSGGIYGTGCNFEGGEVRVSLGKITKLPFFTSQHVAFSYGACSNTAFWVGL